MNDRTALIANVCRIISAAVGFDSYGTQVAWLVTAIAENAKMVLDHDAPFLRVLRRLFPENAAVWQFCDVEKTVCCSACTGEIPVHEAIYGQGEHGMFWAHPGPCPLMPRVENGHCTIRVAWDSDPHHPMSIEDAEKRFGIDAVNFLIDNGYVQPVEAGQGPFNGSALIPTRKPLEL